MRRKKVLLAVGFGIMLTMGTAGCGKEDTDIETPVQIQDTSFEDAESLEKDETQKKPAKSADEEESEDGQDKSDMAAEELTGSVESVSADSFVISKITTEHYDDYDIAFAAAPGSDQEELVTVYVRDAADYTYKTVKNSGINPEDITEREGSFGDLKEGLSVNLKGQWENGDFYADNLEIMEFIG